MSAGGVPASRAIVRWAWRLFRREWRQQALVLGLLATVVAAAIVSAAATYNTVGASANATFGSANHRFLVDDPDPAGLATVVAAARERFGPVDVIGRWARPVPGWVESIEFRAQDPAGAYSGPMLALREGRYPTTADDVALTDGAAGLLQVGLGDRLDIDGPQRTVVGVVENPSHLYDEFVLVAPGDLAQVETVVLLIGGSGDQDKLSDELAALHEFGRQHVGAAAVESRPDPPNAAAAAGVLGQAAIAFVLVSLVATAAFITLAQRRLRQLGLLAAIGTTQRQLRLVVVANGLLLGVAAAAAGAAAGLGLWFAAAPRMEAAVGYRIDPTNLPVWTIGAAVALVILVSATAAWWPARQIARIPVTRALSGRPAPPTAAHGSTALALVLTTAGVIALVWGGQYAVVLVAGTLATVAGVLLLAPLLLRGAGATARWLPVAMRLALRGLVRYRARAAAALAAISLAVGVPAAVVVTASAAELDADEGNLAADQLLVWTSDPDAPEGVSPYYTQDPNDEGFSPFLPRLTAAELTQLQYEVEQLATNLDATVIGLDLVVDPAAEPSEHGQSGVTLAWPNESGYLDVALVFVATPELLRHYGHDPDELNPGTEFLTAPLSVLLPNGGREQVPDDELLVQTGSGGVPKPTGRIERLDPGYTSLPGSLITTDALQRRGLTSVRVGWLLETAAPRPSDQLGAVRARAADLGLLVETRPEQADLTRLRWTATATGLLLALGVLSMTIGLMRGEAARDVRTLTATGARRSTRRAIAATVAGALTLLGGLLGTIGSYLTLFAGHLELADLTAVPLLELVVITVGLPATAASLGWLLAGREPPTLARAATE